jgi:Ras GTPase-activating-like protein IQGAP2/3
VEKKYTEFQFPDPQAEEKALWVQGKRAVLAILRVQPAKDLVESLMQPVTDEHEVIWEGILEEMEIEQMRQNRRMPSTAGADSAYRLEDIRS